MATPESLLAENWLNVCQADNTANIRPASIADIADILAIQEYSFSHGLIGPRQWRYLITKAKGKVIVAVDHNTKEVCGYLVLLAPKNANSCRIYTIAVAFEFRRSGVGSLLIETAKWLAQSFRKPKLHLEMRASSRSLNQFYQRLGFRPQQLLPDYYGEGQNGVRMSVMLGVVDL